MMGEHSDNIMPSEPASVSVKDPNVATSDEQAACSNSSTSSTTPAPPAAIPTPVLPADSSARDDLLKHLLQSLSSNPAALASLLGNAGIPLPAMAAIPPPPTNLADPASAVLLGKLATYAVPDISSTLSSPTFPIPSLLQPGSQEHTPITPSFPTPPMFQAVAPNSINATNSSSSAETMSESAAAGEEGQDAKDSVDQELVTSLESKIATLSYELEVEVNLLRRLERDVMDDKKEVTSLESLIKGLSDDEVRLKKQVDDLETALKIKRDSLVKVDKEKNEASVLLNLAETRLNTRKSEVTTVEQRIATLNASVKQEKTSLAEVTGTNGGSSNEAGLDNQVNSFLTSALGTPAPSTVTSTPALSNTHSHEKSSRSNHVYLDSRPADDLRQTIESRKRRDITPPPMATPSYLHREPLCFQYNRRTCHHSSRSCTKAHDCIVCSGPHPMVDCDEVRSVCVRWNMSEECAANCHREHRCLRCMSKSHRLINCPVPPLQGAEFCFAYNSCGVCKMPDTCLRQHKCIRCRGNHAATNCPDNVEEYFIDAQKRRLNQSSSSSSALSSSVSHNGHSSMSSSSLSVKERLGARVNEDYDDRGSMKRSRHDYDYSDDRDRDRVRGGLVTSRFVSDEASHKTREREREREYHHHQPTHHTYRDGVKREEREREYVRDVKEYRSERGYSDVSGSMSSSGFAPLTERERIGICRDFNNGRCALERCKFRHVCLGCGSPDHRERRCPLGSSMKDV